MSVECDKSLSLSANWLPHCCILQGARRIQEPFIMIQKVFISKKIIGPRTLMRYMYN